MIDLDAEKIVSAVKIIDLDVEVSLQTSFYNLRNDKFIYKYTLANLFNKKENLNKILLFIFVSILYI